VIGNYVIGAMSVGSLEGKMKKRLSRLVLWVVGTAVLMTLSVAGYKAKTADTGNGLSVIAENETGT
jgi:hypothetical protein